MYSRDIGPYSVVLLNLKTEQLFVLDTYPKREYAEQHRKLWRRALGGKSWIVDRRPGMDTLDHICLCVKSKGEIDLHNENTQRKLTPRVLD